MKMLDSKGYITSFIEDLMISFIFIFIYYLASLFDYFSLFVCFVTLETNKVENLVNNSYIFSKFNDFKSNFYIDDSSTLSLCTYYLFYYKSFFIKTFSFYLSYSSEEV